MRRAAALLGSLATAAATAPAQATPRFEPVPGSYDAPIYLTAPEGDPARVFVVERGGLVKVVENGTPVDEPFIDLTGEVTTDGERGLLSLAFPPDYGTSGLVYTYLTGAGGELQIRQHERSAADPNLTQPDSRVVWSHAHPAPTHNGATIQFGPDGMLWLATGDGGGAHDITDNAQRLDTELGKLLRIDPQPDGTYEVPADNPFAGAGDPGLDTIWASGLRNPFRFSFDRETGDLTLGDVGQGTREEVDFVRLADGLGAGGDFGWRCREGSVATPNVPPCEPRTPYIPPVFDYRRTVGRTVTGGVVVRDPGLPSLNGRYLFADFFGTELRSLDLAAVGADPRPTGLSGPAATHVAAFGEDALGRVYVVSLDGSVNRIVDRDDSPPPPAGGAPPPPPPPPAPPPAPAPPPPAAAEPDRRPPLVRMRVRGRDGLAGRLRVALLADEPALATLSGRLRGVARFRTINRRLAAGRTRVIGLRISRKSARKLRRTLRRKRVVVRLTVQVRDAAGNPTTVRRRLVVPRRAA